MKNNHTFDNWFDDQLNKGGLGFWAMLLVFCGGFYSLLFFLLAFGG